MDDCFHPVTDRCPYCGSIQYQADIGERVCVLMWARSALVFPGHPGLPGWSRHEAADRSGEDPCFRPAISVDPDSDS